MAGYDTLYLTGMDEHGLKIEEAAKKNGLEPQEFVDEIASKTKKLLTFMPISLWVICRPRKRMETFTLSPPLRKRCAALALVWMSFSSMVAES